MAATQQPVTVTQRRHHNYQTPAPLTAAVLTRASWRRRRRRGERHVLLWVHKVLLGALTRAASSSGALTGASTSGHCGPPAWHWLAESMRGPLGPLTPRQQTTEALFSHSAGGARWRWPACRMRPALCLMPWLSRGRPARVSSPYGTRPLGAAEAAATFRRHRRRPPRAIAETKHRRAPASGTMVEEEIMRFMPKQTPADSVPAVLRTWRHTDAVALPLGAAPGRPDTPLPAPPTRTIH